MAEPGQSEEQEKELNNPDRPVSDWLRKRVPPAPHIPVMQSTLPQETKSSSAQPSASAAPISK